MTLQFLDKIRLALRLIHCIQKERGTSCPVLSFKEANGSSTYDPGISETLSKEKESCNSAALLLLENNASNARDNTDAALVLFHGTKDENRRQTEGIKESLDHIRLTVDKISTLFENEDNLDTQTQNFYDVILLFNIFIASIINVHIADIVKKHESEIQLRISQCSNLPKKHRSQKENNTCSIIKENDVQEEPTLPTSNLTGNNLEMAVQSISHTEYDNQNLMKKQSILPRYHSTNRNMNHLVRADHLISLLLSIVLTKESSGMQRAVLCSLSQVKEAGTIVNHNSIYSNLILEEANQRKIIRELRIHVNKAQVSHSNPISENEYIIFDENYRSLMSLVEDSLQSPKMEALEDRIRINFDIKGLQESISLEELWSVITLYMTQLYALELLIVEELQSCITSSERVTDKHYCDSKLVASEESSDDRIISSFEGETTNKIDAMDIIEKISNALGIEKHANSSKEILLDNVSSMSAEEIKSTFVSFLESSASQEVNDKKELLNNKNTTEQESYIQFLTPSPPLSTYIPSKEWDISLNDVRFLKRIGRGLGGTTYLAKWGGLDVAVKVAAITDMGLEGWNTEVSSLQKLHHPNIIRLLGSIYNPNPCTYGLVLEFCEAGDLSVALTRWTPSNFFSGVSVDIANGLNYLHSKNVLHRDIKPGNVLLCGDLSNGKFTAKLTDFGVAKMHQGGITGEEHTAETGTYRWMAPEIMRHEEYSFMADVYSFGVVVWQLVTHEEPFKELSQIEAAGTVAIDGARPPIPKKTPQLVEHLIRSCWNENPKVRLSFSEICIKLQEINDVLTDDENKWLGDNYGHSVYGISCTEQHSKRKSLVKKGIKKLLRSTSLSKMSHSPYKAGKSKSISISEHRL